MRLSVLMTIYHRVSVEQFERALGSVVDQTVPADEIVVVEDGPLSPELAAAVDAAAARVPSLQRVRLAENRGSGVASAVGLRAAHGEFVARMDADDVSLPQRFERQLRAIDEAGLDICGSSVLEFRDSPEDVVGVRALPTAHEAIIRYSRFNNPFNNPSVILRRDLALRVGGYEDLRYMQDYDLFVRMLAAGARGANLDEPLVLFNADTQMLRRRAGRDMAKREYDLQRRLLAYGWVGRWTAARNVVVRAAFRMLPAPLLTVAYRALFRRNHAG